jgi:hypothetical protein
MDREGLSKVKRAEFLARLEALEGVIREQETRIASYHARGWKAKESERRLKLLRDSHKLYRSALVHLLGEDFGDPGRKN